MRTYLAVDIGASSGRHILGWVSGGGLCLEEVYRFENRLIRTGGKLCWDMGRLEEEVLRGLARCRELGKIPDSLGIDTWAVDYVLLDGEGRPLGDALSYRDSRTQGMDRLVEKAVPPEELYARTGIQKQPFNTVYQLMAEKVQSPQNLERAQRLLLVPEYLAFRLTGRQESEYTNAATTGLVNAQGENLGWGAPKPPGLPPAALWGAAPAGIFPGGICPEGPPAAGF